MTVGKKTLTSLTLALAISTAYATGEKINPPVNISKDFLSMCGIAGLFVASCYAIKAGSEISQMSLKDIGANILTGLAVIHSLTSAFANQPQAHLIIHTANTPTIEPINTGNDLFTTFMTAGFLTASCYAIKMGFDHFYWTRKNTEQWAYKQMRDIDLRNNFVKQITDISEHNSKFIELTTNFGLHTPHSGYDTVLQAAAPLHSATNSMTRDFRILCAIIKECGKKRLVESRLIDDVLTLARFIEKIVTIIRNTQEYQKEALEIERINNWRYSFRRHKAKLNPSNASCHQTK